MSRHAPSFPLNEGRGMNPGDTPGTKEEDHGTSEALNEGRGMNPGDTSTPPLLRRAGTSLNEGRGMNPGDTANSTKEAVPKRNCTIWWTVEASRRRRLRSSGAFVNDIRWVRSGSTRQTQPAGGLGACGRLESPEVRRCIRGPKADRVRDAGFGRRGAWRLRYGRGSDTQAPNRVGGR